MRPTRRQVLALLGWAGAGTAVGVPLLSGLGGSTSTGVLLRSGVPLPAPFTRPLPVPAVLRPSTTDATADVYDVVQRPAEVEMLPGMQTGIWGYNGTFPGPTIVSRSGRRTVVRHRNELPVPAVVHLHGGRTPPDHDGYPTDEIRPVTGQREYEYPLRQRAATLWYHDHRMDFTGPGVWRGLAGFHLVTDGEDEALPLPRGDRDLPLMIVDRSFAADGSLRYPALDPAGVEPGVQSPYQAGVLGDVIVVNGVAWPLAEVSAARYRLRLLNASNARRYALALDPPPPGGGGLVQIGADGGLLAAPLPHEEIEIAPGQRFDVIVDFGRYGSGREVTLVNRFGTGGTARVMRFRVGGSAPDDSAVPQRLSDVAPVRRQDAVVTRTLRFGTGVSHGMAGWSVNGHPFTVDHVAAEVRLGTIEVWRLISDFHHPIHLHMTHFQVLTRGGGDPGPFDHGWKDTLDLRPSEAAEIVIPFEGYPGRYVFHCHNLEHEDMGMMATILTT